MGKKSAVLCFCKNAYRGKPHILGAGACNGSRWAESYHELEGDDCELCNANNNGICEVASGIEGIDVCEAYQNALEGRYPVLYHPYPLKRYYKEKEDEWAKRYCDHG